MCATIAHVTLHLGEPVRVTDRRGVVRVRRKGLALLAYVALEGPARRETVADVLWDGPRARQNLRVELHRLRAVFAELGIDPIGRSGETLSLSPAIRIEPAASALTLLTGLEDVAHRYQAWIQYQRAAAPARTTREVRGELLDDLARRATAAFVLVVQGAPGSGRHTLARDLARRLGRPFVRGTGGPTHALRYLVLDGDAPEALADTICGDAHGMWVLGHSVFDEDPPLLLRLRKEVPPERLRFVRLGPLPWSAARRMLPVDVGFREGARLYLASRGHPGYLRELLELRAQGQTETALPVPQRIRAAYALEARRLDTGARHALERLAAHGGPLSRSSIDALGAREHLDDLERMGWLEFDGVDWTLTDALAADLIASGVPEAERRDVRRRVHEHTARAAPPTARHHRPDDPVRRTRAGGPSATEALAAASVAAAPIVTLAPGREVLLDEPRIEQGTAAIDDGRILFSRLPPPAADTRVAIAVPTHPLLLRVGGRVLQADGLDGPAFRLRVDGDLIAQVSFGDASEPSVGASGNVRVPIGDRFDHWFLVGHGHTVRLESGAPGVVAEVAVSAFQVGGAHAEAPSPVPAIDLTATGRWRHGRPSSWTPDETNAQDDALADTRS